MKGLIFENNGTIDPRSFKTFGVSAKDKEDAIGFFGTGLKYAIAVILRLKGSIVIKSGDETYHFETRKTALRGKEFEVVTCNDEELAFTTELGKTWEPWQAYRELFSNCLDENGRVREEGLFNEFNILPSSKTKIFVNCPEIYSAHLDRSQIYLEGKPDFANSRIEIYRGGSNFLFYRNFRAHTNATESVFTYNILEKQELTEDRTLKNIWRVESSISTEILRLRDRSLIRDFLKAPRTCWEKREFIFNGLGRVSDEFLEELLDVFRTRPDLLSEHLIKILKSKKPDVAFKPIKLNKIQTLQVDRALEFCERLGFELGNANLIFTRTLGPSVLAVAERNTNRIIISERVLSQGTKQLASTLIEEIVHLREGLDDYSANIQAYLFDKIVSLGEELQGGPL